MTNEVLAIIGVGGMGLSIARRVGAGRTIVLADVNAAGLKSAADALTNDGHRVLTREIDVTSRSSVAAVAEMAQAASGVGDPLPMRSLVAICGGGEIQRNQHMEALYDYDATMPAMRRIVEALFHDPSYPADDNYVRRRHESSIATGAWEALAAARFRRPGAAPPPAASSKRAYERVSVPTLVVEGGCDKLLPPGWAKGVADQIAGGRSAVVDAAGHCPQIEQPAVVNEFLLEFLTGVDEGI